MMAYLTRPGFNGGGAVSNRTVLPKRKPPEEVKKRKKINYEKIKQYLGKESQELIERELGFADGGMLVKPSDDGSRPGYASPKGTKTVSLFAETGLDEHRGIQKTTYPSGTVSYRGGFTRTKTGGRQTTPFRSTIAEARADLDAALSQPKLKTQIELQAERGAGNQLDDPKYKKELEKAFKELKTFEEKGYTDLDTLRNKYKKKFELKVGSKDPVTGRKITKGTQTIKTLAISQAISDRAKELEIYNVENPNMRKALEAYGKIKNRKMGDITRLAEKYKVNKNNFEKFITQFDLREYLPKDRDATRLAQDRAERAAIKKYSSSMYEQELRGTVDIQKSHMGDKYNMPVKTSTIDYAPGEINKFLADRYDDLKIGMSVDAVLKQNTKKLKNLYKNKPAGYKQAMDKLNQKGTEIAMATRGFKKFESIDPNTGKTFVIEGAKRRGGLDPADVLGDRKLSELDKAKGSFDREMAQYLRGQAMKDAKMSSQQIQEEIKLIKQNVNDLVSSVEELPSGAQGKICNALKAGGLSTTCAEAIRQDPIKTASIVEQETARLPTNVGGKALQAARFVKNIFAPAAIAGEVGFEGLMIADKALETGMPLKQAFGESILNLALGPKLRVDVEAERAKEFAKGEDFAMAERGRRKAPFLAQGEYADRLRREARIAEMQQKFPGVSEDALKQELLKQDPNIDLSLFPVSDFKQAVDDQIKTECFADNFRQEKAGGGIMKMAGKSSGPAPESGPTPDGPEGLFSALKYVKKP